MRKRTCAGEGRGRRAVGGHTGQTHARTLITACQRQAALSLPEMRTSPQHSVSCTVPQRAGGRRGRGADTDTTKPKQNGQFDPRASTRRPSARHALADMQSIWTDSQQRRGGGRSARTWLHRHHLRPAEFRRAGMRHRRAEPARTPQRPQQHQQGVRTAPTHTQGATHHRQAARARATPIMGSDPSV